MKKLTFDEALESIGDDRSVDSDQVQARALNRRVWIAEWHVPGCTSESQGIYLTRRDAIEGALDMCGNVRGAATDLRRYGRTDRVSEDAYVGRAITTVQKHQLADIL